MLRIMTVIVLGLSHVLWWSIPLCANDEPGVQDVVRRSSFQNSRIRFERDQRGHVAFMGGSITEMNGYRPMLMEWLQDRFPKTTFQFTDAGISSTCSTAGAFRLQNDVLDRGEVDLFFLEFAVNDDQDAIHPYQNSLRGMEGIVRQLRSHSPEVEIVITYFVNPAMMDKIQKGETPVSIAAHEKVAEQYGVTSIHLATRVAREIQEGTLSWQQYGGVHPAPFGNAIPAAMIQQTLTQAWKQPLPPTSKREVVPLPKLLDSQSYIRGRYLPVESLVLGKGWQVEQPDWKSVKGNVRPRHANRNLITCHSPGSLLSFSFTGTAVGVECVAGPDAGTLEFSIDSGEWQSLNLAHAYSKGLHYPRTVLFSGDLTNSKHQIQVRLSGRLSDFEQLPTARILNFVAN